MKHQCTIKKRSLSPFFSVNLSKFWKSDNVYVDVASHIHSETLRRSLETSMANVVKKMNQSKDREALTQQLQELQSKLDFVDGN